MPDFTTEELPLSVTEDLVPSTAPKPACTTSIDFDGLLGTPLLLQDDPTECGGQLWPGGMVLAKYLLRCKTAELEGKTMFVFVRHTRLLPLRPETAKKSVADLGGNSLELGAGSGLVG